MTLRDQPAMLRPRLSSIVAQLFVTDFAAACAFYTDILGFSVAFTYGSPPYYGQLVRDNAHIALRLVCGPVYVDGIREREHLLSASITLDTAAETKALFTELQAKSVQFHQPLRTQPWGARDFVVRDCEGNLIHFAGPAQ